MGGEEFLQRKLYLESLLLWMSVGDRGSAASPPSVVPFLFSSSISVEYSFVSTSPWHFHPFLCLFIFVVFFGVIFLYLNLYLLFRLLLNLSVISK